MIKNEKIKMLILDVDGTLTDGGIYITENGDEFKKFNTKDGIGIRYLLKYGMHVGIISASISKHIVERRAEMLGIPYCYVGEADKVNVLDGWLARLHITYDQVAFVGDDINDLNIMSKVGLSACPSDASAKIKQIATVILKNKGGDACVREFIEEYLADIA
jgi:3-deoxy-D-manno-octulosonate 8-phosphate phosphatase (KDO 8-P phosphatase)